MTYESKLEWRNAAKYMRQSEDFRRFKNLDKSIKKQYYSGDDLQHALSERIILLNELVTAYTVGHDCVG